MKYINKSGEDVQVSVPGSNPVQWIVIKKGEKKDLPISESRAALNGLYTPAKLKEVAEEAKAEKDKQVEAEESSIGHVKVETKKIAGPEEKAKKKKFQKEVQKIKGIGKKTAKDIVELYGDKEILKKALAGHVPLRDDVVLLLKKNYL